MDALTIALITATTALISAVVGPLMTLRSEAEAITRAGRDVLRAEWARVKGGD
jgi:hypothetical protein